MDKIDLYRQRVQEVINRHASYKTLYGNEVEMETIFDTQRDHYQLVHAGWWRERRMYGCTIHVDIKPSGKIWIQ